jgi:hypothetical protein
VFTETKSGGGNHVHGTVCILKISAAELCGLAKPGLMGSGVVRAIKASQPDLAASAFVNLSALLQASKIPAFSFDQLDWGNQ